MSSTLRPSPRAFQFVLARPARSETDLGHSSALNSNPLSHKDSRSSPPSRSPSDLKFSLSPDGTKLRVPAAKRLEINRLVEQLHLPVRRRLEMLGIKPLIAPEPTIRKSLEDRLSIANSLEPHSRCSLPRCRRNGARPARTQPTRAGNQVYRHRQLLCLGIIGLSAFESP
jgi:hypothetical protein